MGERSWNVNKLAFKICLTLEFNKEVVFVTQIDKTSNTPEALDVFRGQLARTTIFYLGEIFYVVVNYFKNSIQKKTNFISAIFFIYYCTLSIHHGTIISSMHLDVLPVLCSGVKSLILLSVDICCHLLDSAIGQLSLIGVAANFNTQRNNIMEILI